MPGIRSFSHARWIALVALLLALCTGMQAAQASQEGTSGAGPAKADAHSQDTTSPTEPTDPKARKTFASAIDWEKHRNYGSAIDDFRKANRQDGGQCRDCLHRAYLLARQIGAFKDEAEIAREMVPQAATTPEKVSAYYRLGLGLQDEGVNGKKDESFRESCDEFKAVIALEPRFALAHYAYGVSLAYLNQDDAARTEFATFLERDKQSPELHERAQRYAGRVELARATMAPPFSLTTLDGRRISMDSLAGKVVLIDFWATWCGSCVAEFADIQDTFRMYSDRDLSLVTVSVNMPDEQASVLRFLEKKHATSRNLLFSSADTVDLQQAFDPAWDSAVPYTILLSADGKVLYKQLGSADILELRRTILANVAAEYSGFNDYWKGN